MISREARHDYTVFRRALLTENFMQLQKSLYVRNYPTLASAEAAVVRLKRVIPDDAAVAFFMVTDKQYGLTQEFFGQSATRKRAEKPLQVELFS